jgi:hypothetical protein
MHPLSMYDVYPKSAEFTIMIRTGEGCGAGQQGWIFHGYILMNQQFNAAPRPPPD